MGVLAVIGAIGSVVSAAGALMSAGAQASAANYNAKINERNAVIAEQDRKQALLTAEIDAEDKRRENARTLGTIRAMYGSSGLDMSGSPLDVLEDSALELELDVGRVEYEGRARSREIGMKAQGFKESAVLNRTEAKSAKTGGILNAFGYLIGGAGKALQLAN